jgi:hypothetical protein
LYTDNQRSAVGQKWLPASTNARCRQQLTHILRRISRGQQSTSYTNSAEEQAPVVSDNPRNKSPEIVAKLRRLGIPKAVAETSPSRCDGPTFRKTFARDEMKAISRYLLLLRRGFRSGPARLAVLAAVIR